MNRKLAVRIVCGAIAALMTLTLVGGILLQVLA